MNPRKGFIVPFQEYVLIVTIENLAGHDIYSGVVTGLRKREYIIKNLETRQQICQR